MNTADELKKLVKETYAAAANQPGRQNCDTGCGCSMSEAYGSLSGYVPEADLGLGCGLPTEFVHIRKGDVVVDLGSGAGNDAFVARALTGPEGKVIGIDFTDKMIAQASAHAAKRGFSNVEFRYGDIEDIPLGDGSADVVVSNCVLNLVPDKAKAFREIFRILRPGGHFTVSDIVLGGELPQALREDGAMYTRCVSGALPKEAYLRLIADAGFTSVVVRKERKIVVEDENLSVYLNKGDGTPHAASTPDIFSFTVSGEKPAEAGDAQRLAER